MRSRKRPGEEAVEHTYLSIRVKDYNVSATACVNYSVYAPEYPFGVSQDDPLYEFKTQVTINGVSIAPKQRVGDNYQITLYGEPRGDYPALRRLQVTLKDAQKRDKFGALAYRTYRGKEIPIYDPPNGLGVLEKVRAEPRWTSWLFVEPHFVTDIIAILGYERQLFLNIHETKYQRKRWVQGITLQTEVPEEDE